MKRVLMGHVLVDTGQLFLVDPGHLDNWKPGPWVDGEPPTNSYARVTTAAFDNNGWAENVEMGLVFMAPSDGLYPVYVTLDDNDEMIKVEVFLVGSGKDPES